MADTTTSALNWATVENGKVKTTTSKKAMSPTTEPWDMISSLHYFVRKCSTRGRSSLPAIPNMWHSLQRSHS